MTKFEFPILLKKEILNKDTKLAKFKISFTAPYNGYTKKYFHKTYKDLPEELASFIIHKCALEMHMGNIETYIFLNPKHEGSYKDELDPPPDPNNRVLNTEFMPLVEATLYSRLSQELDKGEEFKITITWHDGPSDTLLDSSEDVYETWVREVDDVEVEVVK